MKTRSDIVDRRPPYRLTSLQVYQRLLFQLVDDAREHLTEQEWDTFRDIAQRRLGDGPNLPPGPRDE